MSVKFINPPTDTLITVGPFEVKAYVASPAQARIITPYLHYTTLYNNIQKKDSIRMTAVEGDTVWTAMLPQQRYGSIVTFYLIGRDSLNNSGIDSGKFVTMRPATSGISGYTYYAPQDTTGATSNNLAIIYHVGYATSLSRSLYLSSEIDPNGKGLYFSKLAWYLRANSTNASTVHVTRNLKIWMVATNDVSTSNVFIDPTKVGATLVYNGTTNNCIGWNEVTLSQPFNLPAGKNLYIFYEGIGGTTSSAYIYWAGHTQSNRCTYNYNGNWTLGSMNPLIRLGLGGTAINDSNSAALVSIDNPAEGTVAGKQPVKITLQNKGLKDMTSAKINWKLNGVLQPAITYTGSLPCDFIDTMTIGSYTQKRNGYDTITVWINSPNNAYDSITRDDTLNVIAYGCDSLLKGVYTVGNGSKYDFPSMNDALFVLNTCGIGGDITLKLASGTYAENLDLKDFGSQYNLHITSIAGNADSVIFRPTSGAVVDMMHTRNVKFSYLTFDAGKARSYCVNVGAKSDDVEFYHCTIHGFDTNATSNAFTTIYKASGGTVNNIRFIGNNILGGTDATYFYGGSTTEHNTNILFDSNYFAGSYYYQGYFYYNDITFTHNIFEEVSTGYTYYYGPTFYYCDHSRIEANRIHTHNYANYHYGMRIYYPDSTTYVCNNEIVIHNDHTTSYGLYFYYPYGTVLANNTVLVYGKAATHYGIYSYLYSGYSGTIRNNISIVTEGTTLYPFYTSSLTAVNDFDIDYNCWWSETNVAYLSGAITSLSAYQNNIPSAKHDIFYHPIFGDSTVSLKPKNFIGLDCPTYPKVTSDINGLVRSSSTSMGCYANIPTKNNGALVKILNCGSTSYISDTICPMAVLLNAGSDLLTEATIRMEVNQVVFGKDITWKGNLGMGQMDTVALTCFVPKAGNNTISVYLTGIGSAKDTIHADDTVSTNTFTCTSRYAGTYYIGGNNADFADLNEAAQAITSCGISGPVVLKMRSGKYTATTIDGMVSGANKTNTITVMPDNNASVVIDGDAGTALSLRTTAYWNFEGITIGNTTNGMIGVNLNPDVEYISFHNCNIYASKTATTNTYKAVSLTNASGASTYPVGISFVHNNISGGYYNMYLYYLAGGTANMQNAVNMTLDSNTLTDAYYYGIYSNYYAHYNSLCHNTVTSRSSSGTYYGMYLNYYHNFDKAVEGNRVHVNCSSTGYGIYFYYYKNYASYGGAANTFCNNEVIVRGAGTKYGIYFYMPYQNWEFSHNSIYVESTSGTAYGAYLYNSNTSYKINAINNICIAKGTTPYPIYVSSATYVSSSYLTLDYNNYYSIGSSNIGYAGAAKTSLSAWQSASGMDAHSVSMAPYFVDSTSNLDLKDYTRFICPASKNVGLNINGKVRSAMTMMGAYSEHILEEVDLSMKEFVDPKPIDNVVCYADNTPISISVTNNGLKEADFSKSPLKVSLDVTGASSYHFDTTITRGIIKYMQVDTFYLPEIPTMASGVYNIRITLNDTADHIAGNDTLTLVHNAFRVELPYDIDFSTRPAEFVSNTMAGKAEWEVVQDTVINPDIAPAFGTGCLFFNGAKNPGAYVNAIFNAVNIHDCLNPTLSFWYAHNANCTSADMTMILVTTDGGENYTEIMRIPAFDTVTAWKQYDIDLTPFNQTSCLSVVFRGISFGGSNQAIDRIRIRADKDASFELLPIETAQRTACDNRPVDVKAVVTNKSLMSIDLFNDTITLNVTGAVTATNKYVYNKKLSGLESDTITLGQIDLSVNGYTYLQAYLQSLDDNTGNDTAVDSTIYVMQDIALDSIIGMDDQTFKVSGEQVNVSAVAINKGNILIDHVLFRMILNGNNVVTDTVYTPMKPGDTLVHVLSRPYTVPGVSKDQPYYFLEVRADLDCDGNADNDSISIIGQVTIPDSIDIQVLDITATTPAKGKTKIAPTVRIANIGNLEASSVMLHVDVIDSSNKVVGSISEMVNYLAINETKDIAFTMNYTVPNYTGTYTLKAYVEQYNGDTVQRNDTLSKAFANEVDDTRIRESEGLNWSMGQNIPNPANNVTRIPFRLPQDAEVVFSVTTANGQLIYREQLNANSGDNTVGFNVNQLAGGIYYYSMEYNGQRIVRKMNVVR